MKSILLFVICVSSALALPSNFAIAETCTAENCKRENNCVCASTSSPLSTEKTPQLVTITLDDSLRDDIYQNYVAPLLFNRRNPDGKPISATFYVPHEYTDYERVNSLYNKGFDVAVNAISKTTPDYWEGATVEQLIDQFEGQRKIISKFANILIDDVRGARTPHLQLAGDRTFEAYTKAGFTYENTFIAASGNPIFPFTLEYQSHQPCWIGRCPLQSFPNFWVLPTINFVTPNGMPCNVLSGCETTGTAGMIRDWLIQQYERHYYGNRAPMNFMISSLWFEWTPNSFSGFTQFLDYIGKNKDTFVVSHSEVIRWSQNPVEIGQYQTNYSTKNSACAAKTCSLAFGTEVRQMKSCVACPAVYPWLGNHYGE